MTLIAVFLFILTVYQEYSFQIFFPRGEVIHVKIYRANSCEFPDGF
jgi:hypothetical protein